jgi:glycosyltransferase involved in cell wall biosynthesis
MAVPVISVERSADAVSTISTPRSSRWASMAPPRVITVCHPVWQLGCGGLEGQLLQTLAGLPKDRFRHILVIRGSDGRQTTDDALDIENVRVVRQVGPAKDRLWSLRLARILRKHSVDVLHVRGLTMLPDSVVAARLCPQAGVAFSFHGFEEPERSRFGLLRRLAYRAAAAHCDDCWAVSKTAAEAIASALRLPADLFGVLANGVDGGRYIPAASSAEKRRRLDLPADRLVVLSVGNLKPIKGHDVLLEAVRRLGSDADRLTVVLVGEDYLHGDLQRWVRGHLSAPGGIDVRFVGRQADVLPWYQAADLFVLPSRWEGMSNALLEAMSCRLPVVATAVGGNADVIEHARTGLLVEPGNSVELAMALRWLMKDDTYRSSLGAAARAHVQANFTAAQAVARYADRYAGLAERRRAARAGLATAARESGRAVLSETAIPRHAGSPAERLAGME